MELEKEMTKEFRNGFTQDKKNLAVQKSAVRNGIHESCQTVEAAVSNVPVFSVDVEVGAVANQKASGRCWMFAALNTFRHKLLKSHNLKEFELSQSYTFFWDKYEKANYFHENILKTANQEVTSREVSFLLQTPQQDGGQWDMIVSIFDKYGVVPKTVMPESVSSSASSVLNSYLNKKLRKDAMILRRLVKDNATEEEIAATRKQMMEEIYQILSVSLGTPPETFDFEYRDSEKEYHCVKDLTPQTFFKQFVGINLDDYVSVINAPTKDKPFNRSFTVDMLGNVVGGREVKYLNVDMETFKDLAIKQLKDGESIWYGCDVGQSSDRKAGIMAMDTFDVENLFDVDFTTTKAERLEFGESLMTHAMVLTGVDIVDGKSTKWKVENSWGDKIGDKGFFVMSDEWMDEYTYQIVIKKDYLTEEQLKAFNEEPIVLAPWDPMGSLA
ncbi:bleomycin hydrolase [Granulicatella balaenopterae]|uniref:Aminopeptidase n=1 Tax=Granulicatella balaenopterae TaxID=137733 RepID=A0A1H9HV97_9LACT|nr:C1 family peptidase [Granulicatella balaenopterae]SEQ66261.1 bleomycin hydrolase [Granulicatella balaenopterae]